MSSEERTSTIILELISDYEFRVKFDLKDLEDLIVDESPPLGSTKGPSPSRLLATAVANCLSSSLLFCLRKWKVPIQTLKTIAKTSIQRDTSKRWRVHHIDIDLFPTFEDPQHERIPRCIQQFEDYCVVTESVRKGIPININVKDTSS
jgi:uncharacterized OsmC-like protein